MNLDLNLINKFMYQLPKFTSMTSIQIVCGIFDINIVELTSKSNPSYFVESTKVLKLMLSNCGLFRSTLLNVTGQKSIFDFLATCTTEQIKYICSQYMSDTKLIACAGSGKTRCVIGRIRYMVEMKMAKSPEIYAVTFSKLAASDFKKKIMNVFPNDYGFATFKNYSTIDSLAKSILLKLDPSKASSVEILSISLRNCLNKINSKDLSAIQAQKHIKHIFVDEAQDLNQIQYDILMLFKEYFGTSIHMIGDPNQNIYQFRRSDNFFLIGFKALQYNLSVNFRSTHQIINFSEPLKPVSTLETQCGLGLNGPLVSLVNTPLDDLLRFIVKQINIFLRANPKKNFSDIAIICPTKGLSSSDKFKCGLSVVFNYLRKHKVPVSQLYDESGNKSEVNIKNIKTSEDCVCLTTYHGTKGLEWDVVFALDCFHWLFNRMPTQMDHSNNRYLLYVVATRAKLNLYMCICGNKFKKFNNWLSVIDSRFYDIYGMLSIDGLNVAPPADIPIRSVTEIINNFNDEHLFEINEILGISEGVEVYTKRMYRDFRHLDRKKDDVLFGIFCENVFEYCYYLSKHIRPRKLLLIEAILNNNFLMFKKISHVNLLKKFLENNPIKSKSEFNLIRSSVPNLIRKLLDIYFEKSSSMSDNSKSLICTSEFIEIIEANTKQITSSYHKYLHPKSVDWDPFPILEHLFYLTVITYAYQTNHYHYINNYGAEKKYVYVLGLDLYKKINMYVQNNYLVKQLEFKVDVKYSKLELHGEIDFIEHQSNSNFIICEIKCSKELSIKHFIQVVIYYFCKQYQSKQFQSIFDIDFVILNLFSGLLHRINIKLNRSKMFRLLEMMARVGYLKFGNMTLNVNRVDGAGNEIGRHGGESGDVNNVIPKQSNLNSNPNPGSSPSPNSKPIIKISDSELGLEIFEGEMGSPEYQRKMVLFQDPIFIGYNESHLNTNNSLIQLQASN